MTRTARSAPRALLAALLLYGGAAQAQPGGRSSSAIDVPTLPLVRYTLPNGMTALLSEDHSAPVVALTVWYHVGSKNEKPGRTGFAHLFEHMMFEGSQNVATGEHRRLIQSLGGSFNGSTNEDRTNYYETLPSNQLETAIWLEADRMATLLTRVNQERLDAEREIVKNERRLRVDNQPFGSSGEVTSAALYPASHPYSWPVIGSMTDLSAASLEDVKQFFRTYYAPNNATMVIAGDFNRDSALTWVNRYFSAIPRGPQMPARPVVPVVTVPRDTFLVLEDRVTLARLHQTWRGERIYHENDAPLDILASVLAGDKNSRLYKRLVFDMQVAQDVTAFNNSTKLDGYFSIF